MLACALLHVLETVIRSSKNRHSCSPASPPLSGCVQLSNPARAALARRRLAAPTIAPSIHIVMKGLFSARRARPLGLHRTTRPPLMPPRAILAPEPREERLSPEPPAWARRAVALAARSDRPRAQVEALRPPRRAAGWTGSVPSKVARRAVPARYRQRRPATGQRELRYRKLGRRAGGRGRGSRPRRRPRSAVWAGCTTGALRLPPSPR